jgi:hypothetical protein
MKKLAFATVLLVLTGLTAASADDGPAAGKKGKGDGTLLFKKMDANGDGKVSKEEFKAFFDKVGKGKLKDNPELLDKLFDKLDTDGDGSLSPAEFKKFVEMAAKKRKGAGDNEETP